MRCTSRRWSLLRTLRNRDPELGAAVWITRGGFQYIAPTLRWGNEHDPNRARLRRSRCARRAGIRRGQAQGTGLDTRRTADRLQRDDALHLRQGQGRPGQERLQRPVRRELAAAEGLGGLEARGRLDHRQPRRRFQAVGLQGEARLPLDQGQEAGRQDRRRRQGRLARRQGVVRPARNRSQRSACRIRSAYSSRSASDSYFVRGQKKPRSPSPLRRGTTCTCRWGTLCEILVFTAVKLPSAESPVSMARAMLCTAAKRGSISGRGSSSRSGTCSRVATSTCPLKTGLVSRKAQTCSSRSTIDAASSPRPIAQNGHSMPSKQARRLRACHAGEGSESFPFGPLKAARSSGLAALATEASSRSFAVSARSSSCRGETSSNRSMRHPPGASADGWSESLLHSMKKGSSPPSSLRSESALQRSVCPEGLCRAPSRGGSNWIPAAWSCRDSASMSSTCAAQPISLGASILYSWRTSALLRWV